VTGGGEAIWLRADFAIMGLDAIAMASARASRCAWVANVFTLRNSGASVIWRSC
jgi:hypothetical protein